MARFNVHVDDELYAQLKERAYELGLSLSAYTRLMLRRWLEDDDLDADLPTPVRTSSDLLDRIDRLLGDSG